LHFTVIACVRCTVRPKDGLKRNWRLPRRRASRMSETFTTRWRVWRNIRRSRRKSWQMQTASVPSNRFTH